MAKAKAVNLDFSGVKDRGNFNPKHVAEGDYAAKIVKVEDAKPKGDADGFMYVFTIKLGKFSQNSYPYYCKIQDNQLWKLRNIAVAAGLNVPKKRMKFDPNKVVGKSIGVTMEDDEYTDNKGKTTLKSVVGAVFAISELAGEDLPDDTDDDGFDEDSAPVVVADDEDGSEDEAKPAKKSKKDKGDKGKKKKGKKGSGEDLTELNIDDV